MKTKRSFFKSMVCLLLVMSAISLFPVAHTVAEAGQTEYVIVISVDGGGSIYIQNLIKSNLLPNFKRFQTEGAWTNNARNDFDLTVTLPNHVTIVTARGVHGVNENGHGWISNTDPSGTTTAASYSIQNNKGSYVSSVFDVVHDNGLRTALYATKTKFSLFDQSYNNVNGALDNTGSDNGRDKIDAYVYNSISQNLTNSFISAMQTNLYHYALVHFTDGDTAGHASGWGNTQYNNAIKAVDGYIGQIFDLVTSNPVLQGKTSIILTADHGGNGTGHSTATDPLNYTIPFYVWGPDVEASKDLHTLNSAVRSDPGTERPTYSVPMQPIRNGESANLALSMLGLGAIPDSAINNAQDLGVNSNSPLSGSCGSANGQTLSAPPAAAGLCYSGVVSPVTGNGPWTWKCIGLYPGISASCSADYAIRKQYSITVTAAGVNGGTISGSGINATWNGSALSEPKTITVDHGSGPYTITATANNGVKVTWAGDCNLKSGNGTGTATCTINAGIAAAKNVKATFSLVKSKGRQ